MHAVLRAHPARTQLASAALLLVSFQAHAQQAPQGVPNAGTILQQTQPPLTPAPRTQAPTLQVAPQGGSGLPATAPFQVDAIRIVGNTAFPTAILHALVADGEGKQLTLPQLEALAARITAHYQRNGFPLSRAVVPAQTIAGGAVTIQVLEARYGAVRVDNGTRVDTALLEATAAALAQGTSISEKGLDRTLLLLSDIPGVGVNAILKPGAVVGSADLEIAASHNPATMASLALDNAGNRYIGRARASGTLSLFNPLHRGDILSATVLSTGERMNYGRLSYELLVSGDGTRIGVSYSALRYTLGEEIRDLDANGRAGVASAWIRHPILRGRDASVYGQLQFDRKRLRDRIGISDIRTDRDLDNWVLSLNGDLRDGLWGGGISSWSLAWTGGKVGFQDAAAGALDQASARTRGGYAKWNANFSRVQALWQPATTLALNLAAQSSDRNLDSAEKMSIGGPYTVRAYDVGALSGDTGYFGSLELRHDLGAFAAGRWQASAFVESARIKPNRDAWTVADDHASLSGAGLGLNWDGPQLWRASLSVAAPIGGESGLLAPPASARAWFLLSKEF